jgi:hypothetical protein
MTTLLFLIQYGIITFFILVICMVLFALIGTVLHYFYARSLYKLGDQFLWLSKAGRNEEIYAMCNNEFQKTTSLAEVVLQTEMIRGYAHPDEDIVWHKTHIKKRKGFAVLHGSIFCMDRKRIDVVLTFKRARNHRWYIQDISLSRNFSRSVTRGD